MARGRPDHPILVVLAGVGCIFALVVALIFFLGTLRAGNIGDWPEFGLISAGFAVCVICLLLWERPWLYSLAYALMWVSVLAQILEFGYSWWWAWIFPFMYAPFLLGAPLWWASVIDSTDLLLKQDRRATKR